MFKLMGKKIIIILRLKNCLSEPMNKGYVFKQEQNLGPKFGK